MVLVDTSVWIDHFRSINSPEAGWLAAAIANDADLCICGLILTEALQGIQARRQRELLGRMFDALIYLPMRREGYVLAADVYCAARAKGKRIRNTVDCIIAACAIVNDVPLLQRDKDFLASASVSDLNLVRC